MYEIETFHILIHSIYVSSDIYGRIYYILPWQNIIYSALYVTTHIYGMYAKHANVWKWSISYMLTYIWQIYGHIWFN